MFLFYAPWKHQKTFGFPLFSGDINATIGQKWVKPLGNKEAVVVRRCSSK